MRQEGSLAVTKLPAGVKAPLLMNMFKAYGPIARVKVDEYNGANVVFKKAADAKTAVKAMNGAMVEGQQINVRMVAKFNKANTVCRGFNAGICKKGDECKYIHNVAGDSSVPAVKAATAAPTAPPTVKVAKKPKKESKAKTTATSAAPAAATAPVPTTAGGATLCRHFSRGYCSLGTSCRFAHEAVTVGTAVGIPIKTKPCVYFASGLCTRGDQCAFFHAVADTPEAPAAASESDSDSESEEDGDDEDDDDDEEEEEQTAVAPAQGARDCAECEKAGVATWSCENCDGATYCDACNTAVHKSRVMSKHTRTKLAPPKPKNPVCGECEKAESTVQCTDCDVPYCAKCDASVHKFKSLAKHQRQPLTSAPAAVVQDVAKKPAEKKEKAKEKAKKVKEQPAPTPVASTPATTYVNSVPKYDLSSDDDDSSDDDQAPAVQQQQTKKSPAKAQPARVAIAPAAEASSSTDEEDVAPAVQVSRAPQYDVSSESSDDDDDDVKPTPSPAEAKRAAPGAVIPSADVSSESSDEDMEDERVPAVTPSKNVTPVKATPAPARKQPVASDSDSSSDDDSDDEDVRPQPPVQTPAKRAPASRATSGSAAKSSGISVGSQHSLVRRIEAYAESDSTEVLHLDSNLNGFERLLAHDCAERLGLAHESVGEGLDRHITVSKGLATPGNKRSRSAAHVTPDASGKKIKRHH
ncbi:TPA: hypothetical protein N0F65_010151 [Lagenidium giganteum]|uniref:Uncharacterized protein n=1 Tax=Lagenidium giganteum TaxID=4803 RepID=A0AAV2Z617_9STRA|nr:TPA: hypothetical protein N0F65_010151 [Lagenidium giganteum]